MRLIGPGLVFALTVITVGCSEDDEGLDGSIRDAAIADAGESPDGDTIEEDAGTIDAGFPDAGTPDSGPLIDSGCVGTVTAAQPEYRALPDPGRPRHVHAAARLDDGRVLLAGGFSDGFDFDPDVEIFDPMTDVISAGPPRPTTIATSDGIPLADGRVLITVGSNRPSYLFDATSGWTQTATAPEVFAGVLVRLVDGRVLSVGGLFQGEPTDSIYVYDPANETWQPLLDLREPRLAPGVVVMPDERVFVIGGGFRNDRMTSTEFIDVATSTTSAGPRLTVPRAQPFVHLLLDRRVLVTGGNRAERRGTEIYDPETGRFESIVSSPTPAIGARTTMLCDGRIVRVGGRLSSNATADTRAWIFNPAVDQWRRTGASMPTRQTPSATLLLDGRVLVFGGSLLGDGAQPSSAFVFVPDGAL